MIIVLYVVVVLVLNTVFGGDRCRIILPVRVHIISTLRCWALKAAGLHHCLTTINILRGLIEDKLSGMLRSWHVNLVYLEAHMSASCRFFRFERKTVHSFLET